MKVILTVDIKGKGKKGDVVEVNPSYAQNFLFKQNMAIPANASNLNDNQGQKTAQAYHYAEEVKKCQELADRIKGKTFELELKVGANGKAFGSITKQEVLNKLKEINFPVEKKQIQDFEPIKTKGNYVVTIQLMKEVKFNINLLVK